MMVCTISHVHIRSLKFIPLSIEKFNQAMRLIQSVYSEKSEEYEILVSEMQR